MGNKTDMQDPLVALNSTSQQDEDEEEGLATMSLMDHLEELRWRIFKVLIAIVIGSTIAFVFRNSLITFLQPPRPDTANILILKTGPPPALTALPAIFPT